MKGQQRVTYLIHTIGTGINHQNLIRNVVVRKIIMYKLNIIIIFKFSTINYIKISIHNSLSLRRYKL
jgi:hypothetical protein